MADQEATEPQEAPAEAEGAAVADALLTEPEAEQPQAEEPDWMVQAVKTDPSVRARFQQAMFGQQTQPPTPVDPIAEAQKKLAEINSREPKMDPQNVSGEDVTGYLSWLNEKNAAINAVQGAQMDAFQRQVSPMQTETALGVYVQRAKRYMPELGEIEEEFKDYIRQNNIDPQLAGNQAVMDTIAGNMLWSNYKKQPKKVKAPPPPLDEAYAAQGQQARAAANAAGKPRALTEQEAAVAAWFHMTPEEYADPKYGDVGDQGWEADGVFQITDDRRAR